MKVPRFGISVRLLPLMSLLMMGFASSRPVSEAYCLEWMPAERGEIATAERALALAAGPAPTRGLASATSVLDPAERSRWVSWSERQLQSSHRILDQIEGEGSLADGRREFSRIATRWVEFRGYAERGRVDRMRSTLDQIRQASVRAGASCKQSR